MPLIDYTLEGRVNKVEQAIQRIKTFDPIATGMMDQPYYVAYSGGKDSDAIRILCQLAGVEHDLVHNHTTADAPETVRYVRSISDIQINYPEMSMWQLIEKKGMPPTRLARYCCSVLKEQGGKDRFTMTGVRWAESTSRKKLRNSVEVLPRKMANSLVLNADNAESRKLFENCQLKGKRVINPIVDWTDAEVWELLSHYDCESNPLYGQGFHRVGCVGCPMGGAKKMLSDFVRWPAYKEMYIRAFQRAVDSRGKRETSVNWTSGEAMFHWWVQERNLDKPLEGQIMWEAV